MISEASAVAGIDDRLAGTSSFMFLHLFTGILTHCQKCPSSQCLAAWTGCYVVLMFVCLNIHHHMRISMLTGTDRSSQVSAIIFSVKIELIR